MACKAVWKRPPKSWPPLRISLIAMATKFKTLDVRPLIARGEEPFAVIRSRVDQLDSGHGLTLIAPFLPAPLIELLKGEGFRSSAQHHNNGAWSVNFWKE